MNRATTSTERTALSLRTGYQSGFGNEFATEALAGALPEGETPHSGVRLGCTPSSSPELRLPRRAVQIAAYGCIASGRARSTSRSNVSLMAD